MGEGRGQVFINGKRLGFFCGICPYDCIGYRKPWIGVGKLNDCAAWCRVPMGAHQTFEVGRSRPTIASDMGLMSIWLMALRLMLDRPR